jgi:hypothetical protein
LNGKEKQKGKRLARMQPVRAAKLPHEHKHGGRHPQAGVEEILQMGAQAYDAQAETKIILPGRAGIKTDYLADGRYFRPVAQLAERRSPKPKVGGSIPFWPGVWPEAPTAMANGSQMIFLGEL